MNVNVEAAINEGRAIYQGEIGRLIEEAIVTLMGSTASAIQKCDGKGLSVVVSRAEPNKIDDLANARTSQPMKVGGGLTPEAHAELRRVLGVASPFNIKAGDPMPQAMRDDLTAKVDPPKEEKPKTVQFGGGAVRSSGTANLSFTSMPLIGLMGVARTAGEGAAKYGRFNYNLGIPAHVCLDHAFLHMVMYCLGDRSEPHLEHAAWNLMAAIQSRVLHPEINTQHELDPGARVGISMREFLEAGKEAREKLRNSPEGEALGAWSIFDLDQIKLLLEQRGEPVTPEA